MAEYLSPGVYVEEFDSGPKPMEGVGTSTAGFIGVAERGPVEGLPQLVTNYAEFKRMYGGYLSANEYGDYRFLPYAVEHFFINGGARAFIVRVAPEDAACASAKTPDLQFVAKTPGLWGNQMRVSVTPASKAKTQVFEILETAAGKSYLVKSSSGFYLGDVVMYSDGTQMIYNQVVKSQDNMISFASDWPEEIVDQALLPERVIATCEFNMDVRYGDVIETYENVSFNIGTANFVEKKLSKSELIKVEYTGQEPEEPKAPFVRLAGENMEALTLDFDSGSNGSPLEMKASNFIGTDNGAGKRTGIQAFVDNDLVSIMAVPGVTDANVQLSLVAHCENLGSRFAVLDVPKDAKKVQDIINHRNIFDSTYAALYHPWLMVFDPLDKRNIAIPPSGSVLGIYARTDNSRGVHKAPANEVVRSCVGLDLPFNKGEQDILNPKGVNLIRSFPGMGIRVWGARTVSSDGSWKYINVRRLFIFIEESIKANTNWAVFEPNDEVLWVRVQRTIEVFLTNLWRNGFLAGMSADEAFFVNIGRTTMTQDDIDNGRLICVIGVAPVKPAEFVIFRLTQKAGDAQ